MTDANTNCAACGSKGSNLELKMCNACKAVKYCSRKCQVAHWPVHKTACKKRAAEMLDERLFRGPPPREECPLCALPLPIEGENLSYMSCCGKEICFGCTHAADVKMRKTVYNSGGYHITTSPPCPFCRTPYPTSYREGIERMERRMELGDAEAFCQRAGYFFVGLNGTPVDYGRAFELYTRAVELGSASAHYELGNMWRSGRGRAVDIKKARHHYEQGALKGQLMAYCNLAALEAMLGNTQRAMRLFAITGKNGVRGGIDGLKIGYARGLVTKEELDTSLRAYEAAVDKMRSSERDAANSDQRDVAAEYAAYMDRNR